MTHDAFRCDMTPEKFVRDMILHVTHGALHTYTQTHTHTYTHTHTHTHTHARTHTHAHTLSHTHTLSLSHTRIHLRHNTFMCGKVRVGRRHM